MKTKAVRIYGKKDLRLEEFELPPIKDDEILARVVSDSLCMSSYKAAIQGADHKRVPNDVATNPTIIGHECSGELVEIGSKYKDSFKPGDRFSIQPALFAKGLIEAPGYSFPYIGGNATYIVIPGIIMECGCLLKYEGQGYFLASLSEPMSCIINAFHANYHVKSGTTIHEMGIKSGGRCAILAGAGPMGLGAVDYALHSDRRPGQLVVTDIDQTRLNRAASILTPEEARKNGVELHYVNTAAMKDPVRELKALSKGTGFDDIFVFAPVKPVIELGDSVLGTDGCMNFFAGPTNPAFKAEINFYNVHYAFTKIMGTTGGSTDDMKESLDLMSRGKLNPSAMITHVGGLTAAIETTLNLPSIPGGKKLIYTEIDMELIAIDDLAEKGKSNPLYRKLAEITSRNNGLWSAEAEEYLLKNGKKL